MLVHDNEILSPIRKERPKEAKRLLTHALQQKRILNLNINRNTQTNPPKLGDSITQSNIWIQIIREFSKTTTFPEPKFSYGYAHTLGDMLFPLSYVAMLTYITHEKYQHILEASGRNISRALNVPVPKSLKPLEQIPRHPWFSNWDRISIEKKKKSILTELSKQRIIVIVQTGSCSIKRWHSDHIATIVGQCGHPKNQMIYIVSDAQIRNDTQDIEHLQKIQKAHRNRIRIVLLKDIQELAVYTGIADLLLTTDSGPAWMWGCERKTNSKALVHHIIATPFWQVPNADVVISPTLRIAQKEKLISDTGLLAKPQPNSRTTQIMYNKLNNLPTHNGKPAKRDIDAYLSSLTHYLARLI